MTPEFFLGGRLFHTWADQYAKHLKATDSPVDLEQAAIIASENPEGVSLSTYEDIHGLFIRWANKTTFLNPQQTNTEMKLAVNANMESCDFDDPNAIMRGILDVVELGVDDTIFIHDYKTGQAIKPINELAGKMYAFMVSKKLGKEFKRAVYTEEYVRWNVKHPPLEITAEDYNTIPKYITGIAKKIEATTEFLPEVNSGCTYCEARNVCQAYKEEVEENDLVINSLEDAVRVAKRVFTSDLRSKQAKEILKGFCDVEGDVVFGDQAFGPVTSQKIKWNDVKETFSFLKNEYGDGVYSAIAIGATGLKKVVKASGLKGLDVQNKIDELVENYGIYKPETKFTFHKAKVEGKE